MLSIMQCPIMAQIANYSALVSGISGSSIMKSYKDVNYRKSILNKVKRQAYRLSDEEKNVITKYVLGAVKGEDSYKLMNANLRGDLNLYLKSKDITNPLKARLNFYSNGLGDVISKTRLPENIVLYYGAENSEMQTLFGKSNISEYINKPVSMEYLNAQRAKLVGFEFTEAAFMKATYDKNYVQNTKYRFEIKAPKNLQAVLIDDFCNRGRKEVLINKGYKWKVMNISKEYDNYNKTNYYNLTLRLVLN